MSFARRRGWQERSLASPAAPELEGRSSLRYAAGDGGGHAVTMALAQLCMHTVPSHAAIMGW